MTKIISPKNISNFSKYVRVYKWPIKPQDKEQTEYKKQIEHKDQIEQTNPNEKKLIYKNHSLIVNKLFY